MAQSADIEEGHVTSFFIAIFPPAVAMTITRTFIGPYHTHLQLQQEEQGWKIIELDRI